MEYDPWDFGCLGCAQEAMVREYTFGLIKKEAIEYAKTKKTDVVIFMELQEWRFLTREAAAKIGVLFGREIIHFDQLADP
jgi:hypothetical protein